MDYIHLAIYACVTHTHLQHLPDDLKQSDSEVSCSESSLTEAAAANAHRVLEISSHKNTVDRNPHMQNLSPSSTALDISVVMNIIVLSRHRIV